MAKHMPLILVALLITLALLPTPSLGANVLFSGSNSLKPNQSLVYKQYSLAMQKDCNLVLYNAGQPIWASGTSHMATGCYLQLLSDGELVIFGSRCFGDTSVWRSNTTSVEGSYALVLQHDGSLHVYGPTRWSAPATEAKAEPGATASSIWSATRTDSVLYSADVAPIGTTIANGVYALALRDNCNLTLSDTSSGTVLWQTGTSDRLHDCFVTLEATGEFKIKYMGGETLWSNDVASGYGEYVLVLTPAGRLEVYGPSIWKAQKPDTAFMVSTAASADAWGSDAGKKAMLSEEQ